MPGREELAPGAGTRETLVDTQVGPQEGSEEAGKGQAKLPERGSRDPEGHASRGRQRRVEVKDRVDEIRG